MDGSRQYKVIGGLGQRWGPRLKDLAMRKLEIFIFRKDHDSRKT